MVHKGKVYPTEIYYRMLSGDALWPRWIAETYAMNCSFLPDGPGGPPAVQIGPVNLHVDTPTWDQSGVVYWWTPVTMWMGHALRCAWFVDLATINDGFYGNGVIECDGVEVGRGVGTNLSFVFWQQLSELLQPPNIAVPDAGPNNSCFVSMRAVDYDGLP